jgi:hypothetical protein
MEWMASVQLMTHLLVCRLSLFPLADRKKNEKKDVRETIWVYRRNPGSKNVCRNLNNFEPLLLVETDRHEIAKGQLLEVEITVIYLFSQFGMATKGYRQAPSTVLSMSVPSIESTKVCQIIDLRTV